MLSIFLVNYIPIISVTTKYKTKHAIEGIDVQSSTKFQKDFSFDVDLTKLSPNFSCEYLR